ncbi:unnamed protein product, partial [Laminaria digitata]
PPWREQVFNRKGNSYASDVYSFGVVVWEVLTIEIPWAKASPIDIYTGMFRVFRPEIPADAPVNIASIVQACWGAEPGDRPSSSEMREML